MGRVRKTINILLASILVVCCVSGDIAYADNDNMTSTTDTNDIVVDDSQIDKMEEANIPATIVQEDVSLRGEYEKHFLMSDGSYIATSYNEPVHHLVDGKWEEIDNTLQLQTDTEGISRYRTVDGITDVSFAKSIQNDLVTMKNDKYSISWGVTKKTTDVSKSALQFSTEEVIAPAKAVLVAPEDLSEVDVEEQATMAMKSSSAIQYSNALATGIDLKYVVLPSRVKESIILKSPQDAGVYVVNIQTENLKARLLDTREIEFYNNDTVIFTMWAPYMFDNTGELSEDIDVKLQEIGSGRYAVMITPGAEWLSDPSREYPIVIDPDVSTSQVKQNIIDNSVWEGYGVQDRNRDRLYIGRKSGKLSMAYIKYDTMPTIPANTNITGATQRVNIVANTNTANNASAYRVDSDWDSATISWANKPSASAGLASNISHNNRAYYSFSVLSAVKVWYTGNTNGKNANYGIMMRYYNESIDDYNAFYSADYSVEASRPKLTISYTPGVRRSLYYSKYDPAKFNNTGAIPATGTSTQLIQYRMNCYGYAFGYILNGAVVVEGAAGYKQQPGDFAITADMPKRYNNAITNAQGTSIINIANNLRLDAKRMGYSVAEYTPKNGTIEQFGLNSRLVAVVAGVDDYHFYMQHNDGTWSHKPGSTEVTNKSIDSKVVLTNANIKERAVEGRYKYGVLKFFIITKSAVIDQPHSANRCTIDCYDDAWNIRARCTHSQCTLYNLEVAGDYLETAREKVVGTNTGRIDFANDHDVYCITPTVTKTYRISTTCTSSADFDCKLYDSTGTLLKSDTAAGQVDFTVGLIAGQTYYIEIYNYSKTVVTYNFSIN